MESIAVGDKEFVMETNAKLGAKAIGRRELENNKGIIYRVSKGLLTVWRSFSMTWVYISVVFTTACPISS
jgi:hypothetical protein